MKTLARALLRWTINYYPKPQLEIGRGMLTELEELHGWEALEWTFGGFEFYLELKGASMIKNILSISSVVILAVLASWLYANHQQYLSIGVLVVGVIVAALSQPKSAFWFALIFAMMLPVTHLTQAYMFSSNVVHEFTASTEPSPILLNVSSNELKWKPANLDTITIDSIDTGSTPQYQVTAVLDSAKQNIALEVSPQQLWNIKPDNWNEASSLFKNQPVKLAIFGLPIAFLLAGLTLLLRSRFTKSPPLAM
jgi:hypothetical protein